MASTASSSTTSPDTSADELIRAAAEARARHHDVATAAAGAGRSESRESSEFRVVTTRTTHQIRGGGGGSGGSNAARGGGSSAMRTITSFEADSTSDEDDSASSDHHRTRHVQQHQTTTSSSRQRSPGSDASFGSLIANAAGGANDSRSIVLALRTLQEKIRKLEGDRDFHREQCEQARRAHEQYKADVEEQLHRDRKDFRRREHELQELIARAKQEQQRLTKTLDDTRTDASAIGGESAELLDRERRDAETRHQRLREELEQYRRQVAEERLEVEKSRQQADQARAERDILEATNRRLEHTVKDLLSMNKTLVKRSDEQRTHVDPHNATTAAPYRNGAPSPHNQSLSQPPMRFQSPTLASIQHRTRRTSGGVPHNTSGVQQQHQQQAAATNYYHQHRSSSATQRGRSTTTTLNATTSYRQASAGGRKPAYSNGRRTTTSNTAAGFRANGQASSATEPLNAVYSALEAELRALNKKYKDIIDEANDATNGSGGLGPEVLTAKLNGIMVQIDRKTEQLRLLRATKANATTEDVRSRPLAAKGYDKSTHKTQHMNALRRMAHEHDQP